MNQSSLPLLYRVVLVSFTIIVFMVTIISWYDIKKDRIKDLHYTSSVIKRYYELSFQQYSNTLLNIGERLAEIDGRDQVISWQRVLRKSIQNYDELLAFGYASPDGTIMAFSNREIEDSLPNLIKSENSRRSFLKSKNGNGLSIGEVYYFPEVNDWILPLRLPIRNENHELIAVSTTALQYEKIEKDLKSFGFNPQYQIHLINNDFNITQVYYPINKDKYKSILQKPADFYKGTTHRTINNLDYSELSNSLDSSQKIMVSVPLNGLHHTLNIFVDKSIFWADFKPVFIFSLAFYTLVMVAAYLLFEYMKKKQESYNQALVSREANLKSIFESTNSIIGLFDRDKKLVEFNQAFANYSKMTDNITLERGQDVFALMKNKEIADAFIGFQNRALQGEKFSEMVAYPSENGRIHFLLSYNPIYQNSQITGLSMFVEDITELKKYQSELEEQAVNLERIVEHRTLELQEKNKVLELTLTELKEAQDKLVQSEKMASLGTLATGIGHEINNPLNFIKNGASALLLHLAESKVNLEPILPFFEIIDTGVLRANKIVKSLSHFSREVKSKDELCDINAILDNCLVILTSSLKNKVVVKRNLANNLPKIHGNEGKLHQALLNLLSNAEQAIMKKGEILISTAYDAGLISISIEDTGIGIKPEDLNKIADPFFTTKGPEQGTGLGLFISYNIIEEHNGSVSVSSIENNGTKFTIQLPVN